MTAYVIVEGHGESDAVINLLSRLTQERELGFPRSWRAIRQPGIDRDASLRRCAELVRAKSDVEALLVIHDDEDGCPRMDGPSKAKVLADLQLPFPSAVVLAYPEFESLFLPCIREMAGKMFDAPGGLKRPGLVETATFEGDFEAKRDVKGLLSERMTPGTVYKPSVDQLPLTRLVRFETVREKGLAWFGTLERALAFLSSQRGEPGVGYPRIAGEPR